MNGELPFTTFEVKFAKSGSQEDLGVLARVALDQIARQGYDDPTAVGCPDCPRLRWGVAFEGKRIAVACERVE